MTKRKRNTSIGLKLSTLQKLKQIKMIRRWSLTDMVDLWADREIALIESERSHTNETSTRLPGRSGTSGVSSAALSHVA